MLEAEALKTALARIAMTQTHQETSFNSGREAQNRTHTIPANQGMDSINHAQSNTRFTHPSQSQVGKRKVRDAEQANERPLHLQQPSHESAYPGVFDDEAVERLK